MAMDSGLPSRINLVILDGAHDFRSTFNTGPGRNWRASPFGASRRRAKARLLPPWDRCGGLLRATPIPRIKSARNGYALLYRAGPRMDAGWPGRFRLGPASVSVPLAR
jgi:hypothetical protein